MDGGGYKALLHAAEAFEGEYIHVPVAVQQVTSILACYFGDVPIIL